MNILEFDAVDQIMNAILDFFRKLFDTEAWPSRPSARIEFGAEPRGAGKVYFVRDEPFNGVVRQLSLCWLRLNLPPPVAEAP